MSLSIGDIEGLHLSIRLLSPAEEAKEMRKHHERLMEMTDRGKRMQAEREQEGEHGV